MFFFDLAIFDHTCSEITSEVQATFTGHRVCQFPFHCKYDGIHFFIIEKLQIGEHGANLSFLNSVFESPTIVIGGQSLAFKRCVLKNTKPLVLTSLDESAIIKYIIVTFADSSRMNFSAVEGQINLLTGETAQPLNFYGAKEIEICFGENAFK